VGPLVALLVLLSLACAPTAAPPTVTAAAPASAPPAPTAAPPATATAAAASAGTTSATPPLATATPATAASAAAPPPTATAAPKPAPATPTQAIGAPTPEQVPAGIVRIRRADGATVDVRIEVAADDASRQRGLMLRESMAQDAGMLFVFQGDTDGPFWMKDTLIPLSIAFIGADRRIVSIKDMQPRSTDMTYPGARYRYALEVNQGFFARNRIATGDLATWRGERDSNP
jgi:uncharacterized membrane protein (UPF0127 family)